MKRHITILILALAVLTVPASGVDSKTQVFSGTYDWSDGGSDELRAEFKPAGDGDWKVKFEFRFTGKKNSWKGTATGSLENGTKVSGTARSNGRNWVFEGTVEDGVVRGSHTEIRSSGDRYDTGSFEMKRED